MSSSVAAPAPEAHPACPCCTPARIVTWPGSGWNPPRATCQRCGTEFVSTDVGAFVTYWPEHLSDRRPPPVVLPEAPWT